MSWENEWVGMPEFIQNKKTEYCKIIFRFDSENDLQEFSRLIGQKLTNKTKSSWFPFKPHRSDKINLWVDENTKEV